MTPSTVDLADEEGTPRKVGLVDDKEEEEEWPHLIVVPALDG